jgi:hypothetical protein
MAAYSLNSDSKLLSSIWLSGASQWTNSLALICVGFESLFFQGQIKGLRVCPCWQSPSHGFICIIFLSVLGANEGVSNT